MTETKVVVFDLDGTITRGDTLVPFLRALSTPRLFRGFVVALPALMASLWNRDRRDDAKTALIGATLRGRTIEELRSAATAFAEQLEPDDLNTEIIAAVREHQSEDHRIAIASASPAILVLPIAEMLGIPDVIATELEFDGGVCTGRLLGPNNRGKEKSRRVLSALKVPPDIAYGNLPDDELLLSAAERGFVVKRGSIRAYI